VDHTADSGKSEEVFVPDTAFSSVSPSTNLPSSVSSSDSEDENEDDETQRKHYHLSPRQKGRRNQLQITRVPSAEKRKYSQYKCSTGSQASFPGLHHFKI